jgi:hypothetical protein
MACVAYATRAAPFIGGALPPHPARLIKFAKRAAFQKARFLDGIKDEILPRRVALSHTPQGGEKFPIRCPTCLWSLKIKSDKRIEKTNVKQTVSLFEQADSLFYVWSDYLIKNHKQVGHRPSRAGVFPFLPAFGARRFGLV